MIKEKKKKDFKNLKLIWIQKGFKKKNVFCVGLQSPAIGKLIYFIKIEWHSCYTFVIVYFVHLLFALFRGRI